MMSAHTQESLMMIRELLKQVTWVLLLTLAMSSYAQPPSLDIAQTVIKVPIEQGVSMDDAIDSMKLRANVLNMKLVGHQPLSAELTARGKKEVKRLEIFQFCDPEIAEKIVNHNMNFAAYLPCRITLVEDEQGKGWLVMMDLDLFIKAAQLPEPLEKLAIKVRDSLTKIIQAGAHGEL